MFWNAEMQFRKISMMQLKKLKLLKALLKDNQL